MNSFARRLSYTRRWTPGNRVAALTATLPFAADDERREILRELIRLLGPGPDPRIIAAVGSHWRLLSPADRLECLERAGDEVIGHLDRLRIDDRADLATEIASDCLEVAAPGVPRETLETLLAPAGQLEDPRESVAGAAANALHIIARRHAAANFHRDRLDEALAEAGATWPEHRRPEALEAILHNAHLAGPFLRVWLEDGQQPGHFALRSAARELPAGVRRRLAPHWLALPALRSVAVRHIEEQHDAADRIELWRRSHLLPARGRREAIGSVRHIEHHLPDDDELTRAGPATRRGYLRALRCLPVSPECRLAEMRRMLADASPLTRLMTVLDLTAMSGERKVDELILDACADSDERVAAAAARSFVTIRNSRRRVWLTPAIEALGHSPHEAVRDVARAAPLSRSPSSGRWHCPVAERRELHGDPGALFNQLAADLRSQDPSPRLRAMQMIHRFRAWKAFERELRDAARDVDARIASKAVLLVARLTSPESDHVINTAIRHPDPRVHSNAIEAKLIRRPTTSWVVRMRHDDVPRARANVIRHIIRRTGSAPCSQDILGAMLDDDRPGHRISALWVAERLDCGSLRPRIESMIQSDAPEVSVRAARCARRLAGLAAAREAAA